MQIIRIFILRHTTNEENYTLFYILTFYFRKASGSMSGNTGGAMGGGPSNLDSRPPTMGGGHSMHGSSGNPAVSQGHSVGHPATRGGGYNTGATATSTSAGYGPMGSSDQVRGFLKSCSEYDHS